MYCRKDSDAVIFDLPNQWLWDIVDEFIYQFQSFSQYRLSMKFKTEDDIAFLLENPDVCVYVRGFFYHLADNWFIRFGMHA